MFNLLRSIEAQIQEAYDDLLCAAFKQPIFGMSLLVFCTSIGRLDMIALTPECNKCR